MRRTSWSHCLAIWVCFACIWSAPVHARTFATWTEMVAGGESVRTIVGGPCPAVIAEGRTIAMAPRADPDAAFPVSSCAALLPAGTKQASVDGRPVPVPPASVQRIVVLGDTGCRLKHDIIQDCDDPAAWPFAEVAKSAAAEKPDLVIHVGDYYYRETPCPEGRAGCAGSPHGDAWPSWSDDFFTPAAPLLAVAPWVLVRGNHEQCGRGAAGWFRFLDAGPAPLACPAAAASFAVRLAGLSLYVLDSADTEDAAAPADKVALFRGQLDALLPEMSAGPGWILTHRPIWGFAPPETGPDAGEIGEGEELPMNRTEQEAVRGVPLDAIQLLVSGHVHLFAAASFGDKRPAQLIVGNGGDLRDGTRPGMQARQVTIDGLPASVLVAEQFGYLVLDRVGETWRGTLKAADGSALAGCSLAGRGLVCRGG